MSDMCGGKASLPTDAKFTQQGFFIPIIVSFNNLKDALIAGMVLKIMLRNVPAVG